MDRFFNPVRTIAGFGALSFLSDEVKKQIPLGAKVLIIAWDESVFKLEDIDALSCDFNVQTAVFTASNPEVADLFKLYKAHEKFSADLIVGIGGGSVLDAAKTLCALHDLAINSEDALREIIIKAAYAQKMIPWIGIPTTAGTGSEVTCWATVWDPAFNAKRSVESQDNYARCAIVDAQLSSSMPRRLAVSSALDALCHAAESYWARASNCTSRALALAAIGEVMDNIDKLCEGAMEAKEAMARASLLAGLAFSNTKTTACHAVSYPLTMRYGIAHGTAVSMLLPGVLKLNLSYIKEAAPLLAALRVNSAAELKEKINSIFERAGIKHRLQDYGAEPEDIKELLPLCLTRGRADNNPAALTEEALTELLSEIF